MQILSAFAIIKKKEMKRGTLMHLLVIEDERALCETIVRSLRRLAYSCLLYTCICREHGIRRNLCAAALFGVPAVEAVLAAGSIGQRG